MQKVLTSLKNPIVSHVRSLHRISHCKDHGLFLLEGTHQVQEALVHQWPLAMAFWTDAWQAKNPELATDAVRQIRADGTFQGTYVVSDPVLCKLATTQTPDGIVAVARMPEYTDPLDRVNQFGRGIALLGVQDPGNLGTVVRSAVAAQAQSVYCSEGTVSPYHPKVLRASAGQWFRQPPVVQPFQLLVDRCRQRGVQILGASMDGRCLWDLDLRRPTLFVLGNEGGGIEDKWNRSLDERVSIPMACGVESLNVAMCATLLLYESLRQQSRPPA